MMRTAQGTPGNVRGKTRSHKRWTTGQITNQDIVDLSAEAELRIDFSRPQEKEKEEARRTLARQQDEDPDLKAIKDR